MRFLTKHWYIILLVLLCVVAAFYFTKPLSPAATAERIPEVVDFNFHIRPILSDRCFKCHGPDANQRKANLRLDTEAGLYQALKENPDAHVIVNGDPEHSELYQRLISEDTSVVMPPPYSNLTVSDHEKELIEKWIDQGAKYQKHWAFITPEKREVPDVDNEWVRSDIDRFVFEKLEEVNLEPNETADKERLLKRVSFDLTGLPPSIELQERFLNDNSDSAYEQIVDEFRQSAGSDTRPADDGQVLTTHKWCEEIVGRLNAV